MSIRFTLTMALALLGAASAAQAQQTTLTCTPDATCYSMGSTVTVTLDLTPDATTPATIVGGQFFLTYNSTNLTFVSAAPSAPWTEEIFIDSSVPGQLSYAVGLPSAGGGTGATSGTMATLTFTTAAEVCSTAALVAFDPAHSPPTRLVDVNDATYDQGSNLTTSDLTAITLDGTPPVISPVTLPVMLLSCVADVPLPSAMGGSTVDGTQFATIAMGTVSDNCTTNANLSVFYTDSTPTGDACLGTFQIQRTITITDQCNNSVGPLIQLILVNENVSPVVTAPTAIGVQCLADIPAAVTTQAAFVGIGGAATDNCSADANITIALVSDVSNGFTCPEIITRTYRATDECGNFTDVAQTITVQDTISPVIATSPGPVTVECIADVPASNTALVTATDNCSMPLNIAITFVGDVSDGLTCPETITRTYRATDECGNSTDVTQTITVQDTIGPVIATSPGPVTVECFGDVPASNTALVTATDNCTAPLSIVITFVGDASDGLTCPETITRTYRATDVCGNSTDVTQIITVLDTIGPVIATSPGPVTVECIGDVPASNTALVTATDNCSMPLNIAITFVGDVSDGLTCPETITRTYRATDLCNNSTDVTQIITVQDTIAPTIATSPGPVTVECIIDVPASNTALVTATDNCTAPLSIAITFVGDASDGLTCPETITRTYRATDACGNSTDVTQTITVQDITNPTATAPTAGTAQCTSALPPPATNAAEYQLLPGLPTLGDNCTPLASLMVTHSDGALPGTCPGSFIRTYTITDACGNSVTTPQTINVSDTILPTATAPTNVAVQCTADIPLAATTQAELVAQGGAAADNCTSDINLTVTSVDVSDGMMAPETITRTYTITDECNNPVSVVQTITVNDTLPPAATAPGAIPAQCNTLLPMAATNATEFLALPGMPALSDNCTANANLVITAMDGILTGSPCDGTGLVTRTYTIADESGGFVTVDQTINVQDTTPPMINGGAALPDITFPADAGGAACQAVQSLTPPSATDNCSTPTLVATLPGGAVLTSPFAFPGGTTVITWTATDSCGNISTAMQNVFVDGNTQLDVTVELGGGYSTGTSPSTLTRCITFELHECMTPKLVMVTAEIPFNVVTGMPTIGTATILVPCGNYTCITARDTLHTLRRTDNDNFGVMPVPNGPGTPFVADFTDKTGSGGDNDALVGGNFNDDGFIDIIDFGLYVNRQGTPQTLDTTCITAGPHINITEPAMPATPTGIADTEDFTFLQTNFLQVRDANCCGLGSSIGSGLAEGESLSPRMRISVAELAQLGLADLASSDLNQDGMLDAQDIAAFMLGERPAAQAQQPQASGGKNRTPGGFQDGSNGGSNGDSITGGPRQATR